jgi:uncharacterized protein YecE (DUF72 family)
MGEAAIRFGTSGWSYEDWKGIVYPPGNSPHPLVWMSTAFDAVEINATFYRPLPGRFTGKWLDLVAPNPRFRFAVKLWQRFTHEDTSRVEEPDARLAEDLPRALADAGRLGALLVQFPMSFKRTPANRECLARIAGRFAAYPLAVEFRHDSWNRPEVLAGFRERGIALCSIDQPPLDRCMPPSDTPTAPLAYLRLHGRNGAAWFREGGGRDARYDYLYSEEELRPWSDRAGSLRSEVHEAFVFFNNHYKGQAVVNALELQHAVQRREAVIPPSLLEHYPRLRRILGRA